MLKVTLTMGMLFGSFFYVGTIAQGQESSRSGSSLNAYSSEKAVTAYWAIWYKANANSHEVLYRDPSNGALATFGDEKAAKENALYWKGKYGWYSVNWVRYTRER